MNIQDVIYWVGAVFVYIVLIQFFLPRMAAVFILQASQSADVRKSSDREVFNFMVAGAWVTSIFWGLITIAYILSLQWIFNNVW